MSNPNTSRNEHYEPNPANVDPVKKRRYFSHLAGSLTSAFAVHRQQGLWERLPEQPDKRDWGNVSEHCLFEAARVGVLADLVGLSTDMRRELQLAAALHDVNKKGEKEMMVAGNFSQVSYDEAGRQSAQLIRDAGFSEDIVKLTGSVGHMTNEQAEILATKPGLTEFEKAWLIMRYTDDYTVDSNWATPVELVEAMPQEFGYLVNDIDRRMQKNATNERYAIMNLTYYPDGRTAYAEQQRVGHVVENRLAGLITENTGEVFSPLMLPEVVDAHICRAIEAFGLAA